MYIHIDTLALACVCVRGPCVCVYGVQTAFVDYRRLFLFSFPLYTSYNTRRFTGIIPFIAKGPASATFGSEPLLCIDENRNDYVSAI